MIENNPMVITLNGKVRTENMGLTKMNRRESPIPAMISVGTPPTTFKPPTKEGSK
jgi:hypothetical protein